MTKEEMREQSRQFARDILARLCPKFIMPVLGKDIDVAADFVEEHDTRIRAEAFEVGCQNTISDVMLWDEIHSLREQLKIAALIVKNGWPEDVEDNEWLASLGHQDFFDYVEYLNDSDKKSIRAEALKEAAENTRKAREQIEKIVSYGAAKFKGDYASAQLAKNALEKLDALLSDTEPNEEAR